MTDKVLDANEIAKMIAVARAIAIRPKVIGGKQFYTVHWKPWSP